MKVTIIIYSYFLYLEFQTSTEIAELPKEIESSKNKSAVITQFNKNIQLIGELNTDDAENFSKRSCSTEKKKELEINEEKSDFHMQLINGYRKYNNGDQKSLGSMKVESSLTSLKDPHSSSSLNVKALSIENLEYEFKLKTTVDIPLLEEPTSNSVCSVMICDDEHLIAESVDRLLKKVVGNKVTLKTSISKNGIECLYQIYKECIEGRKVDLLLIDENMPFMTGSECIKILRNLMVDKWINKFKIFSITGYSDSDHISHIKAAGSDGFYSKPISLTMMNDLLSNSDIMKKNY